MISFKKHILLALLASFLAAATGCNTMNGVGKDTEKLGDKIQDKASGR